MIRFVVIFPQHQNKVKGKEPEGASCVRFNIKIAINLSLLYRQYRLT